MPPKPKTEAAKDNESSSSDTDSVASGDEQHSYGIHKTMPVLATDKYAHVVLPDLDEFDPGKILPDATIVAIGKRRTGKTWVLRNIMYLMKNKFAAGIVFSQTDELNKFWQQYVPQKYIYKKYDPAIIKAVFRRQKRILNDITKTQAEIDKEAPFFILLDDVISDQRLKYDETLIELFVAGRHYKLFVLITTQYAKAITPTLRGNTDYVFMMKCSQSKQVEAMWEDFTSFLTKDAFAQILYHYTKDNEVLVVTQCSDDQSVDQLTSVNWWKAIDPGKFKMGSNQYWISAMTDQYTIPPERTPMSFADRLTIRDMMPRPWNQFNFQRQ